MSDAAKVILSKLNSILEEVEKANKTLESIPVLETKITGLSQRMKTLEETVGVYLDKEAKTDKYKDKPKPKESGGTDNAEPVYYSMKPVADDKRPPHWNFKPDGENTLWRMYQSKEGREELQKINKSSKDTEEVKKAQEAIRAFHKPAKKLLEELKEKDKQ